MRYFWLLVTLSSCWQAETTDHRALDTSTMWLSIASSLQTVELGHTIDGTPKKYPLQLHAFINHERPFAKDPEGNFLPFALAYVIFSYWHEQQVYTCVEKDVAIGTQHKIEPMHCRAGEEFRQAARACVDDKDKQFAIDKEDQKTFTCIAASD